MKYDPRIHHRRSIRLKGYDYSKAGAYFITICCEKMACRFGEVNEDGMMLNELGEIAYAEWIKLAERFDCFELDVFQIMPNHMHGIIVLKDVDVNVGATLAVAQTPAAHIDLVKLDDSAKPNDLAELDVQAERFRAGASPAPTASVPDIVGAYKSLVSNTCLKIFKSKNKTMGKLWQRNYYEHIIRDERAYQNISHYIINNPAKWFDDKFYKKR
ncbi:transposase [Pedobacter arcticus]|uniref:transposase n=1 Tax=Pedobacter arcticus TaxID=752140 RepID=UPI00037B23F2|nr:transposase [Pedobacter arcticus]